MKIDRSKVKKSSSEVPLDCRILIDKLKVSSLSDFLTILHVGTVSYIPVPRVADPVHFRPDPDPANQNFKTGSRIRILPFF